MANKKIVAVNARTADATVTEMDLCETVQEATPTNNLVKAEQTLREVLVDLARIKSLLYGGDTELDLPADPMCMANSTWNVLVLSDMAAEMIGDILRRL